MINGIVLSSLIVAILFFLGLIVTAVSFIFLTPIIFTPKSVLEEVVKIMHPQRGEHIIDLGSGDGRILLEIAKTKGVKVTGYEISPIMVMIAKLLAFIKFRRGIQYEVANIFDVSFKDVDKVYCYLNEATLEILNKKLAKDETGKKVFCYKYAIKGVKPQDTHILSNGQRLFEYIY